MFWSLVLLTCFIIGGVGDIGGRAELIWKLPMPELENLLAFTCPVPVFWRDENLSEPVLCMMF